jgi:hypothetical protein
MHLGWGKGRRKRNRASVEASGDKSPRVDQHTRAKRDAITAGRNITINDSHTVHHSHITINVRGAWMDLPVTPEVAELAELLSDLPDALAIIHEVFERTYALAPLDATVEQLLAWLYYRVPPRGERPYLQQVSEQAALYAKQADARRAIMAYGQAQAGRGQETTSSIERLGEPAMNNFEPLEDPYLLVVIDKDGFRAGSFLLLLVLYRNERDADPIKWDNAFVPWEDIKEQLRILFPVIVHTCHGSPLIAFAVRDELLGEDFDQWLMPSRPNGPPADDYRLGEKYRVVVRDLDRMIPDLVPAGDHDEWESRWRILLAIKEQADGVLCEVDLQGGMTFDRLRARLWGEMAGSVVLALLPARGGDLGKAEMTVKDALRAGIAAGVPAAIWLRYHCAAESSAEDDRAYLRTALNPASLPTLPLGVRKLRLKAAEDEAEDEQSWSHPGRRLSLLWADPSRSWHPPAFELPAHALNGDE